MEALWSLERKWKLSSQEAVLVFVCSALAVIGLCATTIAKKKNKAVKKSMPVTTTVSSIQARQQVVHGEEEEEDEERSHTYNWCDHSSCSTSSRSSNSRGSVKEVLMGYVRWSGGIKWEEIHGGRGRGVGCQGRNECSTGSPVWQRPILMGERCELPRFSGLILYDERGHPLHLASTNQAKGATVSTTLRDLLE